jgi:hypothetical protein
MYSINKAAILNLSLSLLLLLLLLFVVNVYNGYKFYPSLLEAVGIRASSQNFRDFSLFTVGSSRKNGPSARCALAENTVCKDVEIFRNHLIMLKDVLN